jgi:hypothetical protein
VAVAALALAPDGLAVGYAQLGKLDVHIEAPLEAAADDFEVQLALAADDHLQRLGIVAVEEGRILLVERG